MNGEWVLENASAFLLCAIYFVVFASFQRARFRRTVADFKSLKAMAFAVMTCNLCVLIYVCFGQFTNKHYLQHYHTTATCPASCHERLPDLVLDWPTAPLSSFSTRMIRFLSNQIPCSLLMLGTFSGVILNQKEALNHTAGMIAFLILANLIAENVTTMPASIGWNRCQKELGGKSMVDEYKFQFSVYGSCAEMMWSGHTVHTMLSTHLIVTIIEQESPVRYIGSRNMWSVKTFIVLMSGLIEGALILSVADHYTVDVFVGALLVLILMTNDQFRLLCERMNPWLGENVGNRLKELTHELEEMRLKDPEAYAQLQGPRESILRGEK